MMNLEIDLKIRIRADDMQAALDFLGELEARTRNLYEQSMRIARPLTVEEPIEIEVRFT